MDRPGPTVSPGDHDLTGEGNAARGRDERTLGPPGIPAAFAGGQVIPW